MQNNLNSSLNQTLN